MNTADLHYALPPELIARYPAERRDASRLLVLDRRTGRLAHHRFQDLVGLLAPAAVLVMNDTRVLPARIQLRRASGGRIDGLFLRESEAGHWQVMLTGAGRLKPGEQLRFEPPRERPSQEQHCLKLFGRTGDTWQATPEPAGAVLSLLALYGEAPLPPYIRKAREQEAPAPSASADIERYQTVYAREPGAVAAPTAGLHFTPELLADLDAQGIDRAFVTLHVGVGTFAPIRTDTLEGHEMHAEWYHCSEETADAISKARSAGRPIVAVGTTSVRVLETCANETGQIRPASGWTSIFIHPPYRFRAVDHLITNFHLPESTLLAMIFAFAGREQTLAAYREAIAHRYRFYSYGDAMLIL